MRRKIVVVLKGYPRLSETFIAQELLGLEQAGLELVIVALRRPTDKKRHPGHDEIKAPVFYLPEYLHEEPGRVLRGARRPALPRAGFWRALARVRRRPAARVHAQPRSAVRAGAGACREWPDGGEWLHAHFIHTPASATRYASLLTRHPLDLLGACQGHLDLAPTGSSRTSSPRRAGP